jgi:hypothetical protein
MVSPAEERPLGPRRVKFLNCHLERRASKRKRVRASRKIPTLLPVTEPLQGVLTTTSSPFDFCHRTLVYLSILGYTLPTFCSKRGQYGVDDPGKRCRGAATGTINLSNMW